MILSSVLSLVTINTHIPFKLNFFTKLNFIQNIIIISISHTNRMSLYGFFAWILLHACIWMSWIYLTVIPSRRVWSILRVGNMIVCSSGCCFQCQFVYSCMEQRYCVMGLLQHKTFNFLYTRSHFSALQNCALIFSTNFQFIFIFK